MTFCIVPWTLCNIKPTSHLNPHRRNVATTQPPLNPLPIAHNNVLLHQINVLLQQINVLILMQAVRDDVLAALSISFALFLGSWPRAAVLKSLRIRTRSFR